MENPSRNQCSVRAGSVADFGDSNNPALKNLTPSASSNLPALVVMAGLKANTASKDEHQGRNVDVLSETKEQLAQLSASNLSPLHATATTVRDQAKKKFETTLFGKNGHWLGCLDSGFCIKSRGTNK